MNANGQSNVYYTSEISPESLVKIFEALGVDPGDNATPLINRIESLHGTHTVEYAAEIGLGLLAYNLIDITNAASIEDIATDGKSKYNVYDINGVKILNNAESIDILTPGVYIINGIKTLVNKQ